MLMPPRINHTMNKHRSRGTRDQCSRSSGHSCTESTFISSIVITLVRRWPVDLRLASESLVFSLVKLLIQYEHELAL